jgi:DNA (cytosine-5)-methyltransferase 1
MSRSTDPKLIHPTNPDLLRQFTLTEHAKIKGVPSSLVEGLSSTIGHEVLGQGVIHSNVKDLGHHIGNALNRFAGREQVPMPNRAPELSDGSADVETAKTIAELAGEVVGKIDRANEERGIYAGRIVAVDGDMFVQDVGRNEGVLHSAERLDQRPKLGQSVNVQYRSGAAKVTSLEKDKQMSLHL